MPAREEFVREVANATKRWLREASAGLRDGADFPRFGPAAGVTTRIHASTDAPTRDEIARLLQASLEGLAHDLLVILDNGTELANRHPLEVRELGGADLGGGLHEELFEYLE